jgi:hypothetical protein
MAVFMFRVAVIFRSGYPPTGTYDIGLHSSIINAIIDEGGLPLWNPYHMGGEPLTNPPGYELFASLVVLFTGMPLLVAQMIIAAFFNAFAVFPAYLISKKIWRSSVPGFLAAFFVILSLPSFEMLSWGGYPNLIAIQLIAIIFYLFLKNTDQPHHFNLFTAALLFGSLIITHSLSFFVLFSVLTLYVSLLLIGKTLKLAGTNIPNATRFFFISAVLGILFVSPWLLRVSSFYLDMLSKGVFLGGIEGNRNLIFNNRYVDINILALIGAVFPTIFMFKASRGRHVDSESLLLIAWYVAPLVLTQSYIVGISVDYPRFMYFAESPGFLILSAIVFYLFHYVLIAIKKFPLPKWNWVEKTASQIVFLAILLVVYVISPLSLTPMQAVAKTDFYTTVKKPEATVIDWIQQRTANSVLFVSDHPYGWWLSGVAKRSTLTATSPEFLLYPKEIEVANSAAILLDTDYYIDNGLIQVREDGGYLARHNPIFFIDRETGPFSLFNFNDDDITVFIQRKGVNQAFNLSDVNIFETQLNTNNRNSAVLTEIRENDLLKVNRTLTVFRGVRFADLSYEVSSKDNETAVDWLKLILYMRVGITKVGQEMMSVFYSYDNVGVQVIFKDVFPQTKIITQENPGAAEFLYAGTSGKSIKVKFLLGLFDLRGLKYEEILNMLDTMPDDYMRIVSNSPLVTSSYLDIIAKYNVDFIVCRDQGVYPKFSGDPNFQVVYNSVRVTIFKVIKHK